VQLSAIERGLQKDLYSSPCLPTFSFPLSDWYDELRLVESYDDATNLMYMVMKGTLSSK